MKGSPASKGYPSRVTPIGGWVGERNGGTYPLGLRHQPITTPRVGRAPVNGARIRMPPPVRNGSSCSVVTARSISGAPAPCGAPNTTKSRHSECAFGMSGLRSTANHAGTPRQRVLRAIEGNPHPTRLRGVDVADAAAQFSQAFAFTLNARFLRLQRRRLFLAERAEAIGDVLVVHGSAALLFDCLPHAPDRFGAAQVAEALRATDALADLPGVAQRGALDQHRWVTSRPRGQERAEEVGPLDGAAARDPVREHALARPTRDTDLGPAVGVANGIEPPASLEPVVAPGVEPASVAGVAAGPATRVEKHDGCGHRSALLCRCRRASLFSRGMHRHELAAEFEAGRLAGATVEVADRRLSDAAFLSDGRLCDAGGCQVSDQFRPVHGVPCVSVSRYSGTGLPIVNIGTLIRVAKREIERTPFGQRLFDARTRAGLKQIPAATLIGISQGTLGELERTGQGSAYTVVMAHVYKCDAHWLATGHASPAPAVPLIAREPGTDAPPPKPPPDFKGAPPIDSDWGQLLDDLPFILPAKRKRIIEEIHAEAAEQRAHLDEMVKRMKKAGDSK